MVFNTDYIQNLKLPYNKRKAIQALLVIRKSSKPHLVEKAKLDLFEMMHKIIYKNIMNYHYQAKIYRANYLITEEEIISECYLVLNACVKNFVRKRDKWDVFVMDGDRIVYDYSKLHKTDFYYYYNKSVTRTVYRRIIQRIFKKHERIASYDMQGFYPDEKPLWASNEEGLSFIEFDLKNNGLDKEEIKLIVSRYKQEKAVEYMDRVGVDSNKYYNTLKSAREKWTN